MRFYRPKVDKIQTHKLTVDTWLRRGLTVQRWPCAAQVLDVNNGRCAGARAGGAVSESASMTARALAAGLRKPGAAVGLVELGAHDLRHYWATRATRNGTPLDRLQDAGGWASPAMPLRYVKAARSRTRGCCSASWGRRAADRRVNSLNWPDN